MPASTSSSVSAAITGLVLLPTRKAAPSGIASPVWRTFTPDTPDQRFAPGTCTVKAALYSPLNWRYSSSRDWKCWASSGSTGTGPGSSVPSVGTSPGRSAGGASGGASTGPASEGTSWGTGTSAVPGSPGRSQSTSVTIVGDPFDDMHPGPAQASAAAARTHPTPFVRILIRSSASPGTRNATPRKAAGQEA